MWWNKCQQILAFLFFQMSALNPTLPLSIHLSCLSFCSFIHLRLSPSIHFPRAGVRTRDLLVIFVWFISLYHWATAEPPSLHLTVSPSIWLNIYPSVSYSINPPFHVSVCPSVHLSICPSVHLSICPSVHLSICLDCLSVHLCMDKLKLTGWNQELYMWAYLSMQYNYTNNKTA